MSIWEILLSGLGLSMDASAVGMTNGMIEPKMKHRKALLIAAFYAVFQFIMPVIGYYCVSPFAEQIKDVAPWLSFALLAFIGGKMIFDCFKKKEEQLEPVGLWKLFIQALATSIDALIVGVTMLAMGTALNIWYSALIIGGITFVLSFGAIYLGKLIGDKFASKAGILGGVVLIGIGLKILIEGLVV